MLAFCAALVAAGCGSSATDSEGGVPIIDWASNRDPTGLYGKLVAECNRKADGKWKIRQVFLPPTVDGQREQLTRRLAAKDVTLDLLTMDVVWTAEFSQAGWLTDVTERVRPREREFVPAALETVTYDGKVWGVPVTTNVPLLYYRTDLVDRAPKTWEEMKATAMKVQKRHPEMAGFVFQANQYEGLTVNSLEFMLAAGAKVIDEDGGTALIGKGDAAEHGLTFMRSLFVDGVSPKAVTTYQEEESRQTFQQGRSVYLRNWPYVYSLANGDDSAIKGKFAVAPLPAFKGRGSASVLGGENYSMSAFTPYPEETWAAMECLTSEDVQRRRALIKNFFPSRESLYRDPAIVKAIPYIGIVRTSLKTGYPRPVTPFYNDITSSIYRNANDVAAGRTDPDDAVANMQTGIQRALDGDAEI